jgi:hypothetical protein
MPSTPLDLLYGALNHRRFQGHAPLDDHFARAAVDIVVRGLGRGASAG